MTDVPTVLYVVGKGRSGSTLLDRLLGQLDGFFSTGELSRLWDWGVVRGYPCSCGRSVWECAVWGEVLDRLDVDPTDGPRLAELTRWALAWPRLPVLLASDDASRRNSRLRSYATVAADLYRAIVEVTGARVVVDSSKWPAHPGLLGFVDGVAPRGLHLTRDPRGVAFSYLRRKPTGGRQPPMPRFHPAHSATSWLVRNALAEVVRRRTAAPIHHVRYEDLADRPDDVLEGLRELVAPTDTLQDGTVGAVDEHLLGGNPDRFDRGPLEIRPDDEWRESMPRRDALVVSGIALPLMGRYGYSLGYGDRPRGGRVSG